MNILEIINKGTILEKKALFQFSKEDSDTAVLLKFNLWARNFFPQYFESPDADFHEDINKGNLDAYRGKLDCFVNITFRGAGKDVKTKLFIPFCILNNTDNHRKYFKVLSADLTNSKQSVTDMYNMLISPRITEMYPETFEKTVFKREETMASFTTATGIKVLADTVGTEQRGAIQEESRPDFIWFNDFESRKTLRSAVITRAIKDNMEEARTSLQLGGACVYTANYISEMGNVHLLVTEKLSNRKRILIVPIMKDGAITWNRYTPEDVEQMKANDDDFMGERMCVKPDTLILTEKGLVAISKLKVGDLVWTHENRLQKIKTVFQSRANNLLDITVNGKTTTITKNHPVLAKREECIMWLKADELCVKDLIVEVRHDNL